MSLDSLDFDNGLGKSSLSIKMREFRAINDIKYDAKVNSLVIKYVESNNLQKSTMLFFVETELEAAQMIAEEMNYKYGASIKLWAEQKPFLETCFNAKGMSEEEKLQKIEKHARAMFETWGTWNEWATNVGSEIYAKTTKMRLGWNEYVTDVLSHLRDFTGSK